MFSENDKKMRTLFYNMISLWRNKKRTLLIIIGIAISTSLITGINIASDSLGTEMFKSQFSNLYCDFAISTEKEFDGNFTQIKNIIEPLESNFTQLESIYSSLFGNFRNACFNFSSGSINWSYYEEEFFNSTLFNNLNIFGIDEFILNQPFVENFIQLDANSSFSFNDTGRWIYLDSYSAQKNNLTIGQNISIGQLYQKYNSTYKIYENYTYSIENITVAGIFEITDFEDFNKLFPINYYYIENAFTIISSSEFSYEIYNKLWNNSVPDNIWPELKWMVGVITDHDSYDYLNPDLIQDFFDKYSRAVLYTDISYSFNVDIRGEMVLEQVKATILQYKIIIFAISLPVLLLGGFLIRTNYSIVLNNRRREIGLLKCRSASNKQIFSIFLTESTFFGILGGILGIIMGYLSSGFILRIFSPVYNSKSIIEIFSLVTTIKASNYYIGIILGILLSILSSIKLVQKYSSMKTIESLQKYNEEIQSKEKIKKIHWLFLIISITSIFFALFFDESSMWRMPYFIQNIMYMIYPIMSAFIPIAPFLLTYEIVKLFCNYSIKSFSKIVSKIAYLFNKKTEFFISRSIIRNRTRSSRLVFIIAMGLSFLMISDTLSASQNQFENDIRTIYLGGDANFYVFSYSNNLTENGIWFYINQLEEDESLNISSITDLEVSQTFNIFGENINHNDDDPILYSSLPDSALSSFYYSTIKGISIDIENYTKNIGIYDRFFYNNDAELTFNKLSSIENSTIVPIKFLEDYNYEIDDIVFIEYINGNTDELETQSLRIIDAYEAFPGIRPSSDYGDDYSLICKKGTLSRLKIDGYQLLVNYVRNNNTMSEFILNDELNQLSDNFIDRFRKIDESTYIYEPYRYIFSENDLIFSMVNFLTIEKIYLISLVTIGIGLVMYVSIQEKSIDFGILRARGVDKKTIFNTQLSEGAVFLSLGVLISLISIFSGFALNKGIGNLMYSTISIPRVFIFPLGIIALELILSVLIFTAVIIIATHYVSKDSDVKNISDVFRVS
jgi:ABC-type antimicrobial peptide transport system permease subunit